MADANLADPGYKDKARCERIRGGLRGGLLGAIGAFLGTVAVTDQAMSAYKKLKTEGAGGLSESEKLALIFDVAGSGSPGASGVAIILTDILQ